MKKSAPLDEIKGFLDAKIVEGANPSDAMALFIEGNNVSFTFSIVDGHAQPYVMLQALAKIMEMIAANLAVLASDDDEPAGLPPAPVMRGGFH